MQILDSSKPKVFADDNFKADKNGEGCYKRIENTLGKGEIARFDQFLIFLQCFRHICNADMWKQRFAWERVKSKITA